MNEQRYSPAAAIKKILGSGKITFICIMFTIAALAAFGDVMDNHLDFDEFEVFGQEVDLGKLIGYEGVELLNMISDAIFILGIIGMLPKLLVAIAFWMIRSGSGEGEKCNKNAILGFNFFKINFMYKAVIQMLGLTVIGLVGIIIIIGTLSGSVDAAVILIEVVALALVIGYFYFFSELFCDFLGIVNRTSRHYNQEFFSAPTDNIVCFSYCTFKNRCHMDKNSVSCFVAKFVIYFLEKVYVDNKNTCT